MESKKINFRLDDETYFKVSVLAAERGLSVGKYAKKLLTDQNENLILDLKLIQTDTKDLLFLIKDLKDNLMGLLKNSNNYPIQNKASDDPVMVEVLLLLREISQPAKVSAAQKKVKALGLTPYNYLEK